jgi:hypothetical protein
MRWKAATFASLPSTATRACCLWPNAYSSSSPGRPARTTAPWWPPAERAANVVPSGRRNVTATGEWRKKEPVPGYDGLPQRLLVVRVQRPRLGPVRLGPQDILVMDEVFGDVGGLFDRQPRKRRSERRILDPTHQLEPGLISERPLDSFSPTCDRPQHDSPAAVGRVSRSTRCAARSRLRQPSHNVGAFGPTASNVSQSARRSRRA